LDMPGYVWTMEDDSAYLEWLFYSIMNIWCVIDGRYMLDVPYDKFKLLTILCFCYGWLLSKVQQGGYTASLSSIAIHFLLLAELLDNHKIKPELCCCMWTSDWVVKLVQLFIFVLLSFNDFCIIYMHDTLVEYYDIGGLIVIIDLHKGIKSIYSSTSLFVCNVDTSHVIMLWLFRELCKVQLEWLNGPSLNRGMAMLGRFKQSHWPQSEFNYIICSIQNKKQCYRCTLFIMAVGREETVFNQ
jgi:hypothetical protein